MAEKKFKAVLEIGGSIGSSLKASFATVTGNTKKLGASLKDLNAKARTLRGEMKQGLGGPDAARNLAKLDRQIALTKRNIESLNRIKGLNVGEKLSKVGSTFARGVAVNTAAAIGIGAAVYKVTAGFGEYADAAAESAQKLSMNTNALIKYKFAAADVGTSAEELETGIAKMQATLEKARDGKGSKVFALLGLDVKKLSRQKPEQQIEAIAEAFKNYHGKVSKTAIAMAMFGKGGKGMVNFLELGKEGLEKMGKMAEALGITLSESDLVSGDVFGTAMEKFKAGMTGLGNTIGRELLPVITKLSDQFTQLVIDNKDEIGKWAKGLADKLPQIISDLKDFGVKLGNIGAKAAQILKPLVGVKGILFGIASIPFIPTVAALGMLAVSFVQVGIALAGVTIAGAPLLLVLGALAAALGAVAWAGWELYKNWDLLKRAPGAIINECYEFGKVIGTFLVEKFNAARDAVFNFGFELQGVISEKIATAKAMFTDLGAEIARSIGGAFDYLRQSVGAWFDWIAGKLSGLSKSLSVFSALGGGVGGVAAAIGTKVVADKISGARANGGPVDAGKNYLVGERGPEIFAPRTSGQIIPNGGSGRVFNITNHFTIHPSQGMDEKGLADLIVSRLDGRQAALAGGALFD